MFIICNFEKVICLIEMYFVFFIFVKVDNNIVSVNLMNYFFLVFLVIFLVIYIFILSVLRNIGECYCRLIIFYKYVR